MPLMALWRI